MKKQEAILHFGSQAALARALGVTRASVHGWKKIPIGRQYQLEVLTDGVLQAERDSACSEDEKQKPQCEAA